MATNTPPALEQTARRFAALGDPTRLQVYRLLIEQPRAVGEVAARLPVSRPAVSQHLRVLHDAGLVELQAEGTRHLYRPRRDGVEAMRSFLDSLWTTGLDRFRAAAEAAAPPPKETPP